MPTHTLIAVILAGLLAATASNGQPTGRADTSVASTAGMLP